MVDKALVDVVQSALEQAYSPPSVLQYRYRFDVFVDIDSYEVAGTVGLGSEGNNCFLCILEIRAPYNIIKFSLSLCVNVRGHENHKGRICRIKHQGRRKTCPQGA